MMIKILLVDDKPIVRQGWRMCLDLEHDLVVVGEAGDGREALELIARLAPDVILLDLQMPVMNGLETLRLIGAGVPVIVMSIHDGPAMRQRAWAAGAFAFASKQEPFSEVLAAIHRAVNSPRPASNASSG